jgi:hypothetical protein
LSLAFGTDWQLWWNLDQGQQITNLRARVKTLEAALRRFGHHSAGCAAHTAGTWMHAETPECGCGLTGAIDPYHDTDVLDQTTPERRDDGPARTERTP